MLTSPTPIEALHGSIAARFPVHDTARVLAAADLASTLHAGQRRPDGSDYIHHVMEVAQLVLAWCAAPSADVLCTALLHDSVEDQAERLVELGSSRADTPRERALDTVEADFGHSVRERLDLLTNPDFDALLRSRYGDLDEATAAERRAELYREHVLHAIHADGWVAAIKLADFSTNAWRLGNVTSDARRQTLRAKYGPLMRAFRALLESLPTGHPLAGSREALLAQLDEVWARDYAAAP